MNLWLQRVPEKQVRWWVLPAIRGGLFWSNRSSGMHRDGWDWWEPTKSWLVLTRRFLYVLVVLSDYKIVFVTRLNFLKLRNTRYHHCRLSSRFLSFGQKRRAETEKNAFCLKAPRPQPMGVMCSLPSRKLNFKQWASNSNYTSLQGGSTLWVSAPILN